MKFKIISNGTNSGTFLINEETGAPEGLIQKLTWESEADGFSLSKTTIELYNIPVEIIAMAEIELVEANNPDHVLKTLEKEVKIVSTPDGFSVSNIKIFDNKTQEPITSVQKIKWEATPYSRKIKIRKYLFGNE